MNTEQERAEFEVWRRKHYDYDDLTAFEIEFAFAAFQAGRAALQSQDREDALTKLVAACPTNLHCDDFHHTKADQHMSNEACPPLARYLAAIDHARRIEGDGE